MCVWGGICPRCGDVTHDVDMLPTQKTPVTWGTSNVSDVSDVSGPSRSVWDPELSVVLKLGESQSEKW